MPIENESKVVLRTEKVKDLLKFVTSVPGHKEYAIEQHYLDDRGCRLRQRTDVKLNQTKNFFTYKATVGGKTIEIESEITQSDYDSLKKSKSVVFLKKTRHAFLGPDDALWELDIFYDAKLAVYLVMAEVEYPDNEERPPLPHFFEGSVLYEVPKTDKRFNNKNLTKPGLVRSIVSDLVFRETMGANQRNKKGKKTKLEDIKLQVVTFDGNTK